MGKEVGSPESTTSDPNCKFGNPVISLKHCEQSSPEGLKEQPTADTSSP